MKKRVLKVAYNNWPVRCTTPFVNCQKIHPLQQEKVSTLINHLSEKPFVKNITIFGSSTTDRCHIGSDVDIYVELTENRKTITTYLPFVYDLWTNYTVSDDMYEKIKKEGVLVYERKFVG